MRRSSCFAAALTAFVAIPPPAGAQDKPAARQISDAVSPLPEQMQPGAKVLGFRGAELVELRAGTNEMICLADAPMREGFHTACYHESLEPFMARGRALRSQGLSGNAVDSIRLAEFEAGTLPLPEAGASLYSITTDDDTFDPSGGLPAGTRGLWVLYLPYATEASIGVSAIPARDRPWLMYPGKATAHVMIGRVVR
jgi:hypothetical protein